MIYFLSITVVFKLAVPQSCQEAPNPVCPLNMSEKQDIPAGLQEIIGHWQYPGSTDKCTIIEDSRTGKPGIGSITSPASPPAPYGKKLTRFGFHCIYIYALEI